MKTLEEIKQNNGLTICNIALDGGNGFISVGGWKGTVVWSFGGGWEHVSVCPRKKQITPSWEDMCLIKDMFFKEDECVVQYHPPKSQYVNFMENCLHLWRPIFDKMPMPPSIMVGPRDGQTKESMRQEIKDALTKDVKTNGDKIRNMSDEDLAHIIMCPYDTSGDPIDIMPCVKDDGVQYMATPAECNACCVKWLQREVTKGGV